MHFVNIPFHCTVRLLHISNKNVFSSYSLINILILSETENCVFKIQGGPVKASILKRKEM